MLCVFTCYGRLPWDVVCVRASLVMVGFKKSFACYTITKARGQVERILCNLPWVLPVLARFLSCLHFSVRFMSCLFQRNLWAHQHQEGGRGVHTTEHELGAVLQRTIHPVPYWGSPGEARPLHEQAQDQNRSKVHQVGTEGLEQEGEVVAIVLGEGWRQGRFMYMDSFIRSSYRAAIGLPIYIHV